MQEVFVNYNYHSDENSYKEFVRHQKSYSAWYVQEFKKMPVEEAKAIWDS